MSQMAQPAERPDRVFCLVTKHDNGYGRKWESRRYYWTQAGIDRAVQMWYNGRDDYYIEQGEILWSEQIPLKEA